MGNPGDLLRVVDSVFASLQSETGSGKEDEDEDSKLVALDVLVGAGNVDKAVQLVRKRAIVRYVAEGSERTCWHVKGDNGVYLCVEGYCSCRSFASKLLSPLPLCKHLLAVRIAALLRAETIQRVSPEDYAQYLYASF